LPEIMFLELCFSAILSAQDPETSMSDRETQHEGGIRHFKNSKKNSVSVFYTRCCNNTIIYC